MMAAEQQFGSGNAGGFLVVFVSWPRQWWQQ